MNIDRKVVEGNVPQIKAMLVQKSTSVAAVNLKF